MKKIDVVAACIWRKVMSQTRQATSPVYEVLLFKRKPNESGGGMWEFPGGKVELGESNKQALCREIKEELGVDCLVGTKVGENIHQYPQVQVHLIAYLCQLKSYQLRLVDHSEEQWFNQEQLLDIALAPADIPLVIPLFEILNKKN